MTDKRDERINDRLDEMSGFYKHSNKDAATKKLSEQEKQKNDILNELPANLVRYLLAEGYKYGDNIDSLRHAYEDYKKEHAIGLEFEGSQAAKNNERRQDNVRERVLEQKKERQKEQEHTRPHRSRERQYVRE